jgi:hypothetical protein
MNILKWKQALERNNLIKEYKDVIHGFTHVFDQGIPSHGVRGLPFYTPEKHTSAMDAKEKIEEGFAKEIKAKRVFGPFSHTEVQT